MDLSRQTADDCPGAPPAATGRRRTVRVALLLLGAGALALAPPAGGAGAQAESIGSSALQQMALLLAEKTSRSPAQRKIDSRLLFELRRERGELPPGSLTTVRTGVPAAADGSVEVDVTAEVSDALVTRVEALGGRLVGTFPRFDALRARLPLAAVETLAALPEVRVIRPADRSFSHAIDTTEGDVAHGADTARVAFGVDGTGVQVGAMSDSVDALASLQASGDLPATVTVLAGQSGNPGSSEGTALLEIVFDMAPGADLFFATGKGGQAQMAQNVLDLAAAGCDVIVDDIGYFAEPVFQDGVIAQAVDAVAASGVLFFSAAGNSGNLDHGTAGVWEGDFAPIALPAPLSGAGLSAHDFGAGADSNQVTEQALNDARFFTLQWADPLGGAVNDYDLFLLDAALANVLDFSTDTQDGTQNPFEDIDSQGQDDTGNRLVVVLFSGVGRFLHLNTHRGLLEHATDGQIFGHPAAEGALAVAAVDVATAGGGEFTGGAANPVEAFTSDGPRRIFFTPGGTPLPLAEGPATGVVRRKPDLTAADGVSTATPGFNPFFGTSASAPHSAALGALFKELFPGISTADAYDGFRSGALDIEGLGFDRDSGAGIMMADESLTTIFSDGFESGDTSVWTTQEP